ncbi:hypothetical protein [Hydrogenophaga sp. ANAO-22]|uniref:hypothetical protein n=1 Tax=Hydrogenophaga sp. ANAO-22 TaxID=3166645 RepID=UPI0036D21055
MDIVEFALGAETQRKGAVLSGCHQTGQLCKQCTQLIRRALHGLLIAHAPGHLATAFQYRVVERRNPLIELFQAVFSIIFSCFR